MSELDESSLEPSTNWGGEAEDAHSVAGRARIRAQLQEDIEKFLSQGGKIQEVDTTFRSDYPRKVDVGFNNSSI